MWKSSLFFAALILLQFHCEAKRKKKEENSLNIVCSSTCDLCTDLLTDLMTIPKTCSKHCKCLDNIQKIMNPKKITPCKTINSEIFCKLGRKIDENNCATDNCNTWLPCSEEKPLSNCTQSCPHGYKMDIFGCPTCECRCLSDKIGYKTFVHECSLKCNNRYDIISLRTDTCPKCNCTIEKKIVNKQKCINPPKCPENCGSWGVIYDCNVKSPSCKCDCPMNKLECLNIECAWGVAEVIKDEYGCTIGCNCPEKLEHSKADQLDKKIKCPLSVKCPLECGPYILHKENDFRGCLRECRCECIAPLCHRPCPNNKVLNDIYGCPTCDCQPDWTNCPNNCTASCGPHDRLEPNDERGCPLTCDCNCPRAVYNQKDLKQIDIPRPPLLCPVRCDSIEIKRDRFGCDSCECKAKQCPSIRCDRFCGPHGFVKDRNDCETCSCDCPKTDRCLPCPNGRFVQDGYGCETCRCECPNLVDCDIDCEFGRVTNDMGCEICKCAINTIIPQRRKVYHKSRCNDDDCDEDCEYFKRFRNGCKKCECCRPLHCPGLDCRSGILEVDKDQCPICKCAKNRKQLLSKSTLLKKKQCSSMANCKIRCPKQFLKVDENHCPVCECCEESLSRDCPFLKCNKFLTDKNGCPLCECEDHSLMMETVENIRKPVEKSDKCPRLNCDKHVCEHPKLDVNGCVTCDCCTDFFSKCPNLHCDSYKVDIFGCAICECQQMHLEIIRKPLHKCSKDRNFYDQCSKKCENFFHKVNENNCPICECCNPKLIKECPRLRCDMYKTDNYGCPLCECVERQWKEVKKKHGPKCVESLNCKNVCQSGFFQSKGDCSTCNCCRDALSECPQVKCNIYKTNDENCPICECASYHSNKEESQHSLVNTRCPPLKCHKDCLEVNGLMKLGPKNCHICECCEPYLKKCPHLKCQQFKAHPKDGCPICECVQ